MHRLKNLKHAKLVVLNLIILLLFFYNFFFIFYPIGHPDVTIEHQNPIFLDGKTLFIADVHFNGDPIDLGTFLKAERIHNLVIIGDLYNYPHVYYQLGLQDTLQRLNLETFPGSIYFIWGDQDPQINISAANFQTLGTIGFFITPHHKILAHHGNYRSRFGFVAFTINYFISYPIIEHLWRKRVGVPDDVWIFTGHSHIAKLHSGLKLANCGGFQAIPFFQPRRGEGILVDEYIRMVSIPF